MFFGLDNEPIKKKLGKKTHWILCFINIAIFSQFFLKWGGFHVLMFRHVFLTFLLSIILNVITIFIGIVSNVSSMMCHTAFSPLSKFYSTLYVFNLITANICVEFGMECLVLFTYLLNCFQQYFNLSI